MPPTPCSDHAAYVGLVTQASMGMQDEGLLTAFQFFQSAA